MCVCIEFVCFSMNLYIVAYSRSRLFLAAAWSMQPFYSKTNGGSIALLLIVQNKIMSDSIRQRFNPITHPTSSEYGTLKLSMLQIWLLLHNCCIPILKLNKILYSCVYHYYVHFPYNYMCFKCTKFALGLG